MRREIPEVEEERGDQQATDHRDAKVGTLDETAEAQDEQADGDGYREPESSNARLLEDLGEVDLAGIHWIIIGGESGPGARPMRLVWAESLIEQGRAAGCRVFFKQTGAVLARKRRMRDVKGANPREWPASLCVQESPGGHPYAVPQQPRQLSLP